MNAYLKKPFNSPPDLRPSLFFFPFFLPSSPNPSLAVDREELVGSGPVEPPSLPSSSTVKKVKGQCEYINQRMFKP